MGGAFQNDLPALNIDASNTATLVYQAVGDATGYATNPPVALHNAVSGNEQLLSDGVIVSGTTAFDNTLNPRTAIGLAPGNRLVLLTVDGRQPGVSEGMTTAELADLLHSGYAVTDAINLDGGGGSILEWSGGKTTLVWPANPNAANYALYRGTKTDLPKLLTGAVDSCTRYTGAAAMATGLIDNPAPGELQWFVVVSVNGGGGAGGAGFSTSGPRIANSTGVCP